MRLDDYKNKLLLYRYLAFVLAMTTTFSAGSVLKSLNKSNFKAMCESSYYVKRDVCNPLIDKDESVILRFYERMLPENLDFSDFPYSDGSIEASVNIALYIRELTKNIPNEFKYEYILDNLCFTPDEFSVFCAVIHNEAKPGENRYVDAFAGVTSVFNRHINVVKSGYVKSWMALEGPVSLYQHITAPNQYSPYGDESYLEDLNITDDEAYQACLDALFVMNVIPERMHPYMDFVANRLKHTKPNGVQFVENGDCFSNPLTEDATIPMEERYYFKEKSSFDVNLYVKNLGRN